MSKNRVHTGIVSGWVIFTLFSLITLLLFGRANLSYSMKFIHVAFELSHIVLFFAQWGWKSHSIATVYLAVGALVSTFNMPCSLLYDLTGIGAILDTANFVICVLMPKKSKEFVDLTIAFFWHASYIWAFLLMSSMVDTNWILLFRTYGLFSNALSIFYGTRAVLSTVHEYNAPRGQGWIDTILAIRTDVHDASECICVDLEYASYGTTETWKKSVYPLMMCYFRIAYVARL